MFKVGGGGGSYSNKTSSSKGCSHFTDNTCLWGGVKMWDFQILPDIDFVATGEIYVSQTRLVFSQVLSPL